MPISARLRLRWDGEFALEVEIRDDAGNLGLDLGHDLLHFPRIQVIAKVFQTPSNLTFLDEHLRHRAMLADKAVAIVRRVGRSDYCGSQPRRLGIFQSSTCKYKWKTASTSTLWNGSAFAQPHLSTLPTYLALGFQEDFDPEQLVHLDKLAGVTMLTLQQSEAAPADELLRRLEERFSHPSASGWPPPNMQRIAI